MNWFGVIGNILLYTDTSFLTLKKVGASYSFSVLLVIIVSSTIFSIVYAIGRKRIFKKLGKGLHNKINNHIIGKFGYLGLVILMLTPLFPGKEVLPVISNTFGLRFTLPICLLLNALRIIFWFKIFF